MNIRPRSGRPTQLGSPEWFTGSVYMDEIAEAAPPSHLRVQVVTFIPGARTAWHTHPLRQVLYATQGAGRVQLGSHLEMALAPGDTVVIPAGQRHWHGAAPDHSLVHMAFLEADPHTAEEATWYEQVDVVAYEAFPVSGAT
jgi:quercetin dioxygenase-like cupin family protein